ncbi:putative NFX1-type zinc finger-containing protein 1 [Apostichopus japonicus]|uniref:Putative NFX1-type zinc finger-containing protein 1 n=1 Tax=Stichopus japonicus TaxID=307972 RepID=A0A2G8LS10_STIJA|nr:putative NFX1-type zinc finger-containing protein 1 [Apostichopus japonicus]
MMLRCANHPTETTEVQAAKDFKAVPEGGVRSRARQGLIVDMFAQWTLVCGHECKSTCTEFCPPCVKQCENRCKHSSGPKMRSICTPCQEVCEWSCAIVNVADHVETLQRLPCDEPCRKILPCKHECIGVCGETCPKLCRICDKDEVTEVLFGMKTRTMPGLTLEDCDHIIEVVALDTWMKQTTVDEDTTVQLRVCPKCKTPIRRNLRYGNVIKQVRADVEEIKKQILGDPVNIREKREELIQDLSLERDGTVSEIRRVH